MNRRIFRKLTRGMFAVWIAFFADVPQAAEGRTQIASAPFVISESGSYVLTADLLVDANTTAITVTTSFVTIDLNGFAIRGPSTCSYSVPSVTCSASGTGRGVDATAQRGITVRNGSIVGTGAEAVIGGRGTRIANLKIAEIASDGLVLKRDSSVTGSTFRLIDGHAVAADRGSLFIQNDIYNVEGSGIRAIRGESVIRNNAVGGLGGAGISIPFDEHGSAIYGNAVRSSFVDGISVGGASSIYENVSNASAGRGISAESGSVVVRNSSSFNGGAGFFLGTDEVAAKTLAMENAGRFNTGGGLVLVGCHGNNVLNGNTGSQISGILTQLSSNMCGGNSICP